jgi:hypothetical protein
MFAASLQSARGMTLGEPVTGDERLEIVDLTPPYAIDEQLRRQNGGQDIFIRMRHAVDTA